MTIHPLTVFVFGNPDILMDALPLRILPRLSERLPGVRFELRDPNEDWDIPERLVVLDTVVGITEPKVFEGLDAFVAAPNLSVHDFDAYANLRLLQKLGRVKAVTIIGLPPHLNEDDALSRAISEITFLAESSP